MSVSQPHSTGAGRTASEGFLRVLFGVVLAVVAVALTIWSAEWFSVVTVLMVLLGAREWHRMVRSPATSPADDQQPVLIQTAITGVTVALAVTAILFHIPAAGLHPVDHRRHPVL